MEKVPFLLRRYCYLTDKGLEREDNTPARAIRKDLSGNVGGGEKKGQVTGEAEVKEGGAFPPSNSDLHQTCNRLSNAKNLLAPAKVRLKGGRGELE